MDGFIPNGLYRHYKGNQYLVLGLARIDETNEPGVVYVRLYERDGLPMTVRSLRNFQEEIELPDGRKVPRFTWLGQQDPRLEEPALAASAVSHPPGRTP